RGRSIHRRARPQRRTRRSRDRAQRPHERARRAPERRPARVAARHRGPRGRDPAARARVQPAPGATPLSRAVAWLVVRLSFLLVPAWIAAALAAAHYLPPIRSGADTPLGGLVPGGAGAITAELREYHRFGTTLLTRVVVVQHAPRPLTRGELRRTLQVAARVDLHRAPLLRHVRFAAP